MSQVDAKKAREAKRRALGAIIASADKSLTGRLRSVRKPPKPEEPEKQPEEEMSEEDAAQLASMYEAEE